MELLDRVRAALVDRYDVERELGRGGMAFVYAARDLKNERPVAIKVMRPEIAAALGPERFLREIKIEQRLQHGHILPLLDSDAIDELPYYVMPFVTGETLRHRLERENQLPVEEALHIAGQVAEALDYAHREGVIHRDIKPENILLAGDTAYVADFGIARAAGASGGEWHSASGTSVWLSSTGVVVGTPGYMSPEQASAGRQLDGRSDQYSLACVMYEMLTGEKPFSGSSLQAIVAKMLSLPAPSVRVVRERVPGVLDRALQRGLAKSAADRFATCSDFVTALRREPSLIEAIVEYPGTRYAAAILTVAVAATVVVKLAVGNAPGERGIKVDTTRYVIFPPEYQSGAVAAPGERQRLQKAFSRWTGLSVVDELRLNEALGKDSVVGTQARASEIARQFGAGRFVRVSVSPLGDSLSMSALLYDATRNGGVVRDASTRIDLKRTREDSVFMALADVLLFGDYQKGVLYGAREAGGTLSFPARQAYLHGQEELKDWNLATADSGFAAAARFDPEYTQAFLGLAQVRYWNGNPTTAWQSAAERAAARRDRLGSHDRILSDALVALARGEIERARRAWLRLTVLDPNDFTAWYGLANCIGRDETVIRDPASESGWSFRSSYYQAIKAYKRAFELFPSIHVALSPESYGSVRRLLFTSGSETRRGHAVPPDTMSFAAYPSWQGDTLALVPYPLQLFASTRVLPATLGLAVRRERQLFHDIAMAWVSAFPRTAESMEALAVSLELLGDPTALDTLRRARTLATTAQEQVRLAGTLVWMEVKFSIPSDTEGVRSARELADSLLQSHTPAAARQPLLLASLAALTGRADLAAELSRHPAVVATWQVPAPIARSAGPLLCFAALGGPLDSLRSLEQHVDSAIDNLIPSPAKEDARAQWLGRPAALAFPHYRFGSIRKLVGGNYFLVNAQDAFQRGDTAAVRRILADVQRGRRSAQASDITFDALFPEAWLIASLGDQRAAAAWLDPTLDDLGASAPWKFVDPANAGALVQAFVLRADVAQQVGDATAAARWARIVSVLWSNADAFLQPTVQRMQRFARVRATVGRRVTTRGGRS